MNIHEVVTRIGRTIGEMSFRMDQAKVKFMQINPLTCGFDKQGNPVTDTYGKLRRVGSTAPITETDIDPRRFVKVGEIVPWFQKSKTGKDPIHSHDNRANYEGHVGYVYI